MAAYQQYKILLKTLADLTGISRLGRALTKHSKAVRNIVRLYKALKTAGTIAFKGIAGIARVASRAFLGLAAALGAAVREAVAYNVQMARAWTMMQGGIGQFRRMRKEVKGLAADLGLAKSELAGGLYQALSAGVPENNVIDFLRTAGKVAVADGSSVATAVDGITTVLNAFNLKAEQTDEVVDQLFNTVRNGKTTFGELASSIAMAAPVAAAAGMDFKEMLAAVSTLTKQGTPTAVAMTQIRAAILSLSEELGEGWRKQFSFNEGLEEMRRRAGASGKTLKEFMGRVEGAMAVLGLTGENARQAADDIKSTTDAAGALGDAFGKVDQFRHWSGLWQAIRNQVDAVGSVVDNVLKSAVEAVTAQLEEWRKSTDVFDALEKKLTSLKGKAADIWTAATEVGLGGEVLVALGNLLVGSLRLGAEKAVAWLVRHAPLIGAVIGTAAKRAMTGFYKRDKEVLQSMVDDGSITKMQARFPMTLLNKEQAAERTRRHDELARADAEAKGRDISAGLGGTGQQQVDDALRDLSIYGAMGGAENRAEERRKAASAPIEARVSELEGKLAMWEGRDPKEKALMMREVQDWRDAKTAVSDFGQAHPGGLAGAGNGMQYMSESRRLTAAVQRELEEAKGAMEDYSAMSEMVGRHLVFLRGEIADTKKQLENLPL